MMEQIAEQRRTSWIAAVVALALLGWAGPAASDEAVDGPSMMDRGFDAVVLRPLGAATLLLGSAVALPAIALAAPGGEEGIDNAYDVFVRTPWDNLVNAPLGRGYGL